MFNAITLALTGYVVFVFCLSKKIISLYEQNMEEERKNIEQRVQDFLARRNQAALERQAGESLAANVFTLYELTKEVAKNLKEDEAFSTFKRKLQESVAFKECLLLEPASPEIKQRQAEGYTLFNMQSKEQNLAVLGVEGLKPEEEEKLMILAHQFALALRRIKLYEELEKLATVDSLTELHTRRYFLQRLEEELNRSKKRKMIFSFLMIDVDFFKSFNDRYGHLTGDQILREVARIIQENIREIDIAGRYGGEELSVLLPDTPQEGAVLVAERIRTATEKTLIKAYDATVSLTISIGVATFPEDGDNVQDIIDKADQCLLKAKQQGRNRVCASA